MIRIAIVDDEKKICSQVENILLAIAKEQGVQIDTDVYYDGKQLCQHLTEGEFYDLIFLDIEMDDFSGIDVSKVIRNTMKNEATKIAYISGNKEYAIEIFEYDPLYFLHKPLDYDKIEKVFLRLMQKLHLKAEAFSYKTKYEVMKVPVKDIIYFESDNHIIVIHYYVRDTHKDDSFYALLDNIQEQMKSYGFLRIHKSYLINPIHIKVNGYEKIQMSTGTVLPIAQSKRKEIRSALIRLEENE